MRSPETTTSAPADMWQTTEPLDPAAWVPLTTLALEGFGYADNFDHRLANLRGDLADDILLDDIGRACVPRSVARRMFTDRAHKLAEERDRDAARRAEADANNPAKEVRARVRALQQQQTTGDALADMKRDEFEAGWERAAALRDEAAASDRTGRLQYHPISEREDH